MTSGGHAIVAGQTPALTPGSRQGRIPPLCPSPLPSSSTPGRGGGAGRARARPRAAARESAELPTRPGPGAPLTPLPRGPLAGRGVQSGPGYMYMSLVAQSRAPPARPLGEQVYACGGLAGGRHATHAADHPRRTRAGYPAVWLWRWPPGLRRVWGLRPRNRQDDRRPARARPSVYSLPPGLPPAQVGLQGEGGRLLGSWPRNRLAWQVRDTSAWPGMVVHAVTLRRLG